ncbi:hypothetical protein [Kineococcus rubinsiae]|uniref:hypothetical protein n=1 Tax=Kineococcus rubinsiae TaxID=2609562 RepID=UPI00142FBD3E|nr:hypothetical protein [Kineococcus rubinsiae]
MPGDPDDYRSGKAGEFYEGLDKKAAQRVAARLRSQGRKFSVTDLDVDPAQTKLFDIL